ncbi:hypothetical protein CH249_25930 [Rhodococcus sp. 05-2255-3B1]|nr:hypothetical protein CH249_25930 [Rhodococcus sp. 05-2255-3B1]
MQQLGGPSTATLRGIEGGKGGEYRAGTLEPLEKILRWQIGSISEILNGEDPIELSHQDAYLQAQGLTYEEAYANKVAIPPDPRAGAGGSRKQYRPGPVETYRDEPELDFIVTTMQAALGMLQKRELWIAIQLINQASSDLSDYLDEQNQTNEGDQNEDITQSRESSPSTVVGSAGSGAEGRTPPMNASDKDAELTEPNQGSQADHELAARKGETEDEARERLGIAYD